MKTVNGLEPIEDRPELQADRNRNGRAQVRAPSAQADLRPTASPVDTYVRPAAPPQDNTFLALGRGLAAINPAVGRFMGEFAQNAKPEAEAAATRKLAGMTFEEAQEAVKNGSIPEMSNPWFRAAYMKQFGQRLGVQRQARLMTAYDNDFDKANGNVDELIAKGQKEDLELLGNDKFGIAGYNEATAGGNNKLRMSNAEFKSGKVKEDATQGVYETFIGTYRQLKADGKSPSEIFTALRGNFAGNRKLLNIPYKDQDKELLRAAQAIAEEGDLDTAKAILETPRTGEDGTKLGALKDNREFSTDAARILNKAETERDRKNRTDSFDARTEFGDAANEGTLDEKKLDAFYKANPGSMPEEFYRSLKARNLATKAAIIKAAEKDTLKRNAQASEDRLLDHDVQAGDEGMLPFVEDGKVLKDDGEPKDVTADKRRENAVKAKMESEDRRLGQLGDELKSKQDPQADQKLTAAAGASFNRKIDWLSKNGQTNPQWESVLKSGFAGANVASNSGGPVPPALKGSIKLYEDLYAKNPRLLRLHLKDAGATDFYEAIRVAKTYGGQNEDQAIRSAIKITRDPDGGKDITYRQRYDDLKQAVNSTSSWFGGRSKPKNFSDAQAKIEKLGEFYLRLGMSSDDALKQAGSRYAAQHTQVNGFDVFTGDRGVPPDFGEMAGEAIKGYVRDHPREGLDDDDLTVFSAGDAPNTWYIVDRRTGVPVANAARRALTVNSMRTIAADNAVAEVATEKRRKAEDAAAVEGAARKIGGWFKAFFDATKDPNYQGFDPSSGQPVP